MNVSAWRGYADGRVEPAPEGLAATARSPEEWIWIDLQGPLAEAAEVLAGFGFHPLAIEDAATLSHQPKVEEYDGLLFVLVRGLAVDSVERPDAGELQTGKLAAFLTTDRLVTYHRLQLPAVEAVIDSLRDGRAPAGGAGRVLYQLCDDLIDRFFPVLDTLEDEVEGLEGAIFESVSQGHLGRILGLRRQLAVLRRVMLPHRHVFQRLAFDRLNLLDPALAPYFRDAHDNVFRLADAIDQTRDQLVSVKDTYLSVVGQRTNDVMKVLTMFSAVLLPLTFIAGIYGMNFEHMPELASRWGYFTVLGVMGVTAAAIVLFFRRRGWL
jgi:magnesium transporter